LVTVPGVFMPTCSQKHLPGFVEKVTELKAKVPDMVACVSVNGIFVMKAWKESLGLADGDGARSAAAVGGRPGADAHARRGDRPL
jgi:peroxiredoxin